MKSLFALVARSVAVLSVAGSMAYAADWSEDYAASVSKAKAEKKYILLNFTGSDWCPPCKELEKQVYSQGKFDEYAKQNLVLVKLDFPNQRQLPKATVEQNEKLQEKFEVKGYPTAILLSPEGKRLGGFTGYLEGGPDAFIAKIEGFKK